jgi:hypothetical protein
LCGTALIALSYVAVLDSVQDQPIPRKSRIVLDGNRIYAELDFVRSDRSLHRALAYVDMGSPKMTIRESLFRDLNLDRQEILSFKVGDALVEVRTSDVITEPRPPSSVGSDLKVEAMLPASVLQRYQVVIDYRERSLMLARPGTIEPQGMPVPFSIHPVTGLAVVNASIFGRTYAMTVDNGSAYTWVRQRVAKQWTAAHPDWERGIGAVGPSNMMMSGDTTETMGILMRIPDIAVGSVNLRQVGVLAAGPTKLVPGFVDLFDWYSAKNPVPVIGWIGGNVLKQFRLTLDYPNHTIYWLKQDEPDSHDLNQVGITLHSDNGAFYVAAIATRHGRATVAGVLPGDKLVRIDDLDLSTATWGEVFEAMHGSPGQSRRLILERGGVRHSISAKVTDF